MEDWEQWGEEIDAADIKQAEVANDDEEKKVLEEIAKKEAERAALAKKEESAKEEVRQTQQGQTKGKKAKKNDYEQKFMEKQPHMNQAFNMPESKKLEGDFEEKHRRQAMVEEADGKNIGDMFAGIEEEQKFSKEAEYVAFAQKIAGIVKTTDRRQVKNVVSFVTTLLDSVYSSLSSKDYDTILQKSKVMFNTKQKDEKPTKKKVKGPSINMGTKSVAQLNKATNFDSSDDEKQGNQQEMDDFM